MTMATMKLCLVILTLTGHCKAARPLSPEEIDWAIHNGHSFHEHDGHGISTVNGDIELTEEEEKKFEKEDQEFEEKLRIQQMSGEQVYQLKHKEGGKKGVEGFEQKMKKDVENTGWKLPIPFVFAPGLGQKAKKAINAAIADIQGKTCVRFKLRRKEKSYIKFVAKDGCYSYRGRKGGEQDVSIGRGCETLATAAHEMMHALGFYHEQNRPDRDKYVKIIWDNIKKAARPQYIKSKEGNSMGLKYDYRSVMHYYKNAFAKRGRETMAAKVVNGAKFKGEFGELTDTSGISKLDAQAINMIFRCEGCEDKNKKCPYWAKDMEYCQNDEYQSYMSRTCKRSCGKCQQGDEKVDYSKKGRCVSVLKSECREVAKRLSEKYGTLAKKLAAKYPSGCSRDTVNKRIWYNKGASRKYCTSSVNCVCIKPQKYQWVSSGKCGSVLNRSGCINIANRLGKPFKTVGDHEIRRWPPGCFMSGKVIWYNKGPSTSPWCGSTYPCICNN